VFVSLTLPIVVSAVVLFFASFLSWMVLQLHKKDWNKLAKEEEYMAALGALDVPAGSYMFPLAGSHEEMRTEEFQKKYASGPRGLMTIMHPVNMGQNLGLTLLYFLVVSAALGYLASIAFTPGADFSTVFRFIFTAGLLTFLAAIVQHAIWFRPRIVGHVIESIGYAALTGLVFAALWPAA
jgi:hypothetical protein